MGVSAGSCLPPEEVFGGRWEGRDWVGRGADRFMGSGRYVKTVS